MQHKLLHVNENSRRAMGEAISAFVNAADSSKKEALADFGRGGYFVEGKGIDDFGKPGSPEAAAMAEISIKAYAADNEILATILSQSGGPALTGYFEELLWNIIPEDVNVSTIQQVSVEKDVQTHYLTDKDGEKYVQIYMGVKSITIHNADGTYNKYSTTSEGKLVTDSEEVPTTYMAELNTTVKLETQNQYLNFNVEKLDIRLNHQQLKYNNKVCTTVIKNNNLPDDKSHTKITYNNQYLPTILTGVLTGIVAATGVGILAIIGYAVLNGGPKKAFNKFSSMLDAFISRNEDKSSLEKQFKSDLNQKMPGVYAENSDDEVSEKSQSEKRKSVGGEFKGSWDSMSDKLKNGDPKRAASFESEADVDQDLDTEENANPDHPKNLPLHELDKHLPDPDEDAEETEEPTKD